ncbi:MAG: hypothetical protein GY805_22035 [Chloroflexi bacterium]|nr:hypothetical protein [Chloroflexota bacterium]
MLTAGNRVALCRTGRVQVQFTRGNQEAAKSLLKNVDDSLHQWPQSEGATYLRGYATRMALWQGDLAAARHWQQTFQEQPVERLTYIHEFQSLIRARLLIAEGRLNSSASCFGDALTLLKRIEETAVTAGRFGRAMEAHLLQALAHDALGNHAQAKHLLLQAVLRAERGVCAYFCE